MFVKICGITRTADAQAAIDAGADAIGLNFVPSSRRRVDLRTAREVLDVVADRAMAVGIFQGHRVDEVPDVVAALELDAAQLHGAATDGSVADIGQGVSTVIEVVTADGASLALADDVAADIVMLDAPTPGGGLPFDWDTVGDLVERHRILLAGGLRHDNVAEAIRRVRPWGVDVASGVEVAPGRKDPAAIAAFVAAAKGGAG